MSKLAFLKTITVEAEAEAQPKKGGRGVRKEWNPPTGLTIRIWKDGSVFPSQELVDKFDLEYRNCLPEEEEKRLREAKEPLPFPGNGFDVADTDDFPVFKTAARVLIISPARKDAGKVNLFNSTVYKEDNTPTTSVMAQGSNTFGKTFLIPKIEEIYGITFAKPAVEAREAVEGRPAGADGTPAVKARPAVAAIPAVEGVEYVDMVFVANPETNEPWSLPAGKTVAFFPKVMVKGEDKGAMTTARRENPQMYVFVPLSFIEEEQVDGEAKLEVDSTLAPEQA